jgi:TRAP-type C4-dicarboxylate transport system substrate-binding protein
MKKGVMVLLLVIAFVFVANSFVKAQDVIKLKAANYLPVTHPMSLLSKWFCDEVKKRTNDRVEVSYYGGGTLLNPVKMYDGVLTGIADIGFSHIDYTRGRFPMMEVFDLPLGFPSGWVATQVSTEFYDKYKPSAWKDVHTFYVTTSGPCVVHLVNKPVRTLEELQGLKIRAVGIMSDVIKSLGALPVPLKMPDVYDSLRRGVIDGVTVDLSTLKYWKFAEVEKYVTADWQIATGYTFYWVINKRKWDALPPDIQKVFNEVASEAREKQALLWNQMDIEGRELFVSKGGEVISLSDAEVAKWIKAVKPVIGEYKKSMVSKGFKAAEVDDWLSFIKERIAYWQKQSKQRKVPSPF